MYEGNGRGSIPLFGANAENGPTDFRGSSRMELELENVKFALDCGGFCCGRSRVMEFGGVGRRIVHRACTGNAERPGREFNDRGHRGAHRIRAFFVWGVYACQGRTPPRQPARGRLYGCGSEEIYRNYLSGSWGTEEQNPGRMKIYTGDDAL